MNTDWWLNSQRFDGHAGSFLRVGSALYFKTECDTQFRRLVDLKEPYSHASGQVLFDFQDVVTGMVGTLAAMADTGFAFIQGDTSPYRVTNSPQNYGQLMELPEFDKRQVPAILFQMMGHTQLLYLSRWVHANHDTALGYAWLIDLATPTEPWIVDKGQLTLVDTQGDVLRYRVGGFDELLHIWPAKVLDTGEWAGTDLQRIHDPLSRYTISHALDGRLTAFAPKG